MLRKLLIVDDEPETMQKLTALVNLDELGYSLCAILPDGRDAIEYLKTHQVDVVVTDIIMTFVSGLELCEHVRENYPDVYTVILSGYDDFKYAQSAVSLGVFRYILKPISLGEFRGVLSAIHDEINKKERKRLLDISIASETVSLMKKQLYAEFLSGNISPAVFSTKIAVYEPHSKDILNSAGVLAEIEMLNFHQFIMHSWHYSHDSFNAALERLVSMYENVSAVLINIDDNRFEIILFHQNNISSEVVLNKFVRLFKDITNIDTNILQKECFSDFGSLAGYYLTNNLFSSRIIHKRLRKLGNSFAGYVLTGDISAAQTSLNNIYVLLDKLSLNEAKYIVLELFKPYSEQTPLPEQSIYASQSIDALIVTVNKFTKSLFNLDQIKHQHKIIRDAKDYIIEHCTQDITLEMVADFVHLNHIYFSRLFKQVTGENYSDYLTNLRISKAGELLTSTNMKIYEIGAAVGYKNVKYFSEIFKKSMGVLPSEYRSMTKK